MLLGSGSWDLGETLGVGTASGPGTGWASDADPYGLGANF